MVEFGVVEACRLIVNNNCPVKLSGMVEFVNLPGFLSKEIHV